MLTFSLKKLTAYVNESSGQNLKKIVFVVSYKKKFIIKVKVHVFFIEFRPIATVS